MSDIQRFNAIESVHPFIKTMMRNEWLWNQCLQELNLISSTKD